MEGGLRPEQQVRDVLLDVDAGDAGERLDEAGDGSEEAREGRQVAEHRQVAGPLLEQRELTETGLFHGRVDLLIRTVGAHQARLHDPRERRRVAGADLDRPLDVARRDLRAKKSHQLLLVDDGAAQEHRPLDDDRQRDHQQEQNRPHPPSAFVECVGQHL